MTVTSAAGETATRFESRDRVGALSLWAVAGFCVVGFLLRAYRLGSWGLAGDEIFTLRDSVGRATLAGPKPLLFLLNHYLVESWTTLDETGLRLLPLMFGLAAIPAMFWAGTSLLGKRAGLFAAGLLTLNTWHIYWSQYARYYTLVFLCSTLLVAAIIRGMRDRSLSWAAVGAAVAAIGLLAHPSVALVLGGVVGWALVSYGWPLLRGRYRSRRGTVVLAVLCGMSVAVAAYLTPVLADWYRMDHDWGHRGPMLILSFADGISVPLVLFAVSGLTLLWSGSDRTVAGATTFAAVLPTAFLVAVSYVVPVSNAYLYSIAPVLFFAAAHLLDRLWVDLPKGITRPVVVGACAAAIVVSSAPRLWSHYQTGTRPDIRAAAGMLEDVSKRGDVVLADDVNAARHYLPHHFVRGLRRDPDSIQAAVVQAGRLVDPRPVWILAIRRQRGGFNERDLGSATTWISGHCDLVHSIVRPRLDYKRDDIYVYRCPAHTRASAQGGKAG